MAHELHAQAVRGKKEPRQAGDRPLRDFFLHPPAVSTESFVGLDGEESPEPIAEVKWCQGESDMEADAVVSLLFASC